MLPRSFRGNMPLPHKKLNLFERHKSGRTKNRSQTSLAHYVKRPPESAMLELFAEVRKANDFLVAKRLQRPWPAFKSPHKPDLNLPLFLPIINP